MGAWLRLAESNHHRTQRSRANLVHTGHCLPPGPCAISDHPRPGAGWSRVANAPPPQHGGGVCVPTLACGQATPMSSCGMVESPAALRPHVGRPDPVSSPTQQSPQAGQRVRAGQQGGLQQGRRQGHVCLPLRSSWPAWGSHHRLGDLRTAARGGSRGAAGQEWQRLTLLWEGTGWWRDGPRSSSC